MNDFQKEFDQRLRRVCGVTDDNLKVRYEENRIEPQWTSDYSDTDVAQYQIDVAVYKEVGTYKVETVAQRVFSDLPAFLDAVMAVEL